MEPTLKILLLSLLILVFILALSWKGKEEDNIEIEKALEEELNESVPLKLLIALKNGPMRYGEMVKLINGKGGVPTYLKQLVNHGVVYLKSPKTKKYMLTNYPRSLGVSNDLHLVSNDNNSHQLPIAYTFEEYYNNK